MCRMLFLLLMTLATPAFASDGVLEINQTCAVQTGCFSGDTAGFPVTIDGSAGRSYRLTSDLVVSNENTSGIQIGTSDVGVDLNNFTIMGPVVCGGLPMVCTPSSGTGSGVEAPGSEPGISVHNGSIKGMGSVGVLVGSQAEISNLRVRSNRLDGISAGGGSKIEGNMTYQNGRFGIAVGSGSTVVGNSAYQNIADGIAGGSGTVFSGNAVTENGADGIRSGIGATITGNTANWNAGDGIQTNEGCMVSNNTLIFNFGFGLRLGTRSGYRENVISGSSNLVTGSGTNLGNNLCNGSTVCP